MLLSMCESLMRKTDLIVFDLGGTTIEDHGEVPTAFFAALNAHQIPVAESELLQYRGRSKREVMRLLVHKKFGVEDTGNEDLVERIYGDFRKALEQQFRNRGVIPVPKAEQVFSWLRQQRVKIALTTGFDRNLLNYIVKKLDWDKGIFDATVCSDDVPQGRPAPFMIFRAMEATHTTNVHHVMKIGDTPVDIQAGINAGVQTIGVLTGPYNTSDLRKENPNHIIPNIAKLPELLEQEGYL